MELSENSIKTRVININLFNTIVTVYLSHPLTSVPNFSLIIPGDIPLSGALNAREVAK